MAVEGHHNHGISVPCQYCWDLLQCTYTVQARIKQVQRILALGCLQELFCSTGMLYTWTLCDSIDMCKGSQRTPSRSAISVALVASHGSRCALASCQCQRQNAIT